MATKLTKEAVLSKIVDKVFLVTPSKKKTFCVLTLENGFEAAGSAGVVDPANYVKELGEEIAFNNALAKVWELEGYLLQETLHRSK